MLFIITKEEEEGRCKWYRRWKLREGVEEGAVVKAWLSVKVRCTAEFCVTCFCMLHSTSEQERTRECTSEQERTSGITRQDSKGRVWAFCIVLL